MAVTERELEVLALGLDAVADTEDFHLVGVALGHALHEVGDQRAVQAVQGTVAALVVGPGDHDGGVFLRDGDRRGDGVAEFALGSLDGDGLAVDGDGDAAGISIGFLPIRDMFVYLPYQT